MEPRLSKKILIAIGAVFCCLAILQWGVIPVYEHQNMLRNKVEKTKNQLLKLKELQYRYKEIQGQYTAENHQALKKTSDFSLFSFIEEKASQNQIKGYLEFMRPASQELDSGLTEYQVQMQFQKIPLTKLIQFLKHVEYSPQGIYTKRLTVRSPREASGELQVDILVATLAGARP
jgi:type II secretory pathway component PulM